VRPATITGHKKLIFIHHSTGENWLTDGNGALGIALRNAGYFVSDTYYGWGPDTGSGPIGDRTDIGNWYEWFNGPSSSTYMNALYIEYGQNSSYSRLATDPGGQNEIIMFKSCFPNSNLGGNPSDSPTTGANPLRGESAGPPITPLATLKASTKTCSPILPPGRTSSLSLSLLHRWVL